jgi:UDP-4-amino-4,6-dideoxy-N-acetyl-beta-L-altrosamine N-acetyltransferase
MSTLLRSVTPEDSPTLLRWRNLPAVAQYMYTDHTIEEEEHRRWFERAMTREDARYWIIASDGHDLGFVAVSDIVPRHGTASWAFYIAEEAARGRGVGAYTEFTVLEYVFRDLQLRKLNCEVLATNPAVISMHERFGFVQEGRFREQVVKADISVDVYRLGILQREWAVVRDEHRRALMAKGILSE